MGRGGDEEKMLKQFFGHLKIDGLVKSLKRLFSVIPA
jgi:hypothetical protein